MYSCHWFQCFQSNCILSNLIKQTKWLNKLNILLICFFKFVLQRSPDQIFLFLLIFIFFDDDNDDDCCCCVYHSLSLFVYYSDCESACALCEQLTAYVNSSLKFTVCFTYNLKCCMLFFSSSLPTSSSSFPFSIRRRRFFCAILTFIQCDIVVAFIYVGVYRCTDR